MTTHAMVSLGEVAAFIRGINFKPDDVGPVGAPGSIACMRTKNVQTELAMDDVWGVPEAAVRRDEQVLREGDILVSSANSWNLVGKCCWIPELPWRASFGGFVSVLRASSDRVDARYLYRWFASEPVQALLRSFGQKTTNISNLNIDRCLALTLPLPPLAEQRRIAAILDQAETLRAQRRAAIAQLDSLGQAIFLEMFGDVRANDRGWPADKALGDVADVASGVTKGRNLNGKAARLVPYLAVANVQDKALKLEGVKSIEATDDEIRRYRLYKNDLLLTEGGDPDKLGRGTLWNDELPEAIHQNHIFRVRVTSREITPLFLNWLVGSQRGKQYFLKSAKQTTGIASVNMTQLRGFPLLLPPVAIQEAFAGRTQAVEQLKANHRTALVNLDELFASLQHRAFRGELTAPDTAPRKAMTPRAVDFEGLRKLEGDAGLEALIFVINRRPDRDLYASLKTLYVADKMHLEKHGQLIYGETYNALPMGPVPEAAYLAVKVLRNEEMFSPFDDAATRAAMKVEGKQLIPLRDADLSKLDSAAIQSLESAIRYFAGATFEQVKQATHDAAYDRTARNGSIAVQHLVDMLPAEARKRHWDF